MDAASPFFFFFQADDGIRDLTVTGVQTCALPISRAEGNPFFTEQLVAATLADASEDGLLQAPAGLPARLAELLAARAGRCAGNARAVLAGLAVAGRPLAEEPLAAVTGLSAEAVR